MSKNMSVIDARCTTEEEDENHVPRVSRSENMNKTDYQERINRPRSNSRATKIDEDGVSSLLSKLQKRNEQLEARQAKYEEVAGHYKKAREALIELTATHEQLKEEYGDADHNYHYIVQKYFRPYSKHLGVAFDDTDHRNIKAFLDSFFYSAMEADSLRNQIQVLKIASQEASMLRNQVQTLQKEMLARVDKVQAMSDEQFTKDFRVLVAMIKSLSRMIEYLPGVDPVERLSIPVLLENVSPHQWRGRTRMKNFAEPYVWSVLIQAVFCHPFKVLGRECDGLHKVWSALFGAGHWHQWPSPTHLSEPWRCTTAERLVELTGTNVASSIEGGLSQLLDSGGAHRLQSNVVEVRQDIVNTIMTGLASIASVHDMSQIHQIVDKAVALSMRMAVQRSRIQVTYPMVGYSFVEGEMTQLCDDDDDEIKNGVVELIHHPGLTKWGDAHGKNLEHKFDIMPSLVQVKAAKPVQQVSYSEVVKRTAYD
jgi:hypothetical protein